MKKILSFVAAAVIALSFASCNENGPVNPEKKDVTFTIAVSEIGATSATFEVTPSDTNVYYYWTVFSAADIKGLAIDTVAAKQMAAELEDEATFESLIDDYMIVKGVDKYTYTTFMPETEYVAIAFCVDSALNVVGKAASKSFTTTQLVISETVDVTADGELLDFTEDMGVFNVSFDINAAGAYIDLTLDAENIEGTFTAADIDSYFGGWVVITEDDYYPIVSVNLTGVLSTNGEAYLLRGEIIGGNAIRYNVEVQCAVGAADGAPAKKLPAAMKGFKKVIRK